MTTYVGDVAHESVTTAEDRIVRDRARTDIRRALVLVVAVGSFLAGLTVGNADRTCDPSQDGCRFADGAQVWQTVGTVTWPVCQDEGSAGPCVWDASRDGNGAGRSFTVDRGTVTYLP